MTTIRTYSLILLAAGTFFVVRTAESATASPTHEDDYLMFYEDLLPYGEWFEAEPGMLVWRPFGVYDGWRPYSHGRWVWTRYGWYWVSNEPFGWAVFHYGRWSVHPRYGWVWHPGRVWGPAWVEWRYGDSYVGWAPLPPYAVFHVSFGVRFTRHWVAPVDSWCFVTYSSFGGPIYRDRLLPDERIHRIIGTTRRGPTASIERDGIVNRGVDREMVERRGSIRVERYEIAGSRNDRRESIREGRIEVYRPDQDERRRTRPSPENGIRGNTRRSDEPRRSPSPEFSRPQQERETVRPDRSPSRVPDRRVAPNVRERPERSAPPPSRTPDRSPGRKRDH